MNMLNCIWYIIGSLTAQNLCSIASPCQIGNLLEVLLEVLTRPWTLHILWALSNNGPMRFGVLCRPAS